jgi:O-antigen ligase
MPMRLLILPALVLLFCACDRSPPADRPLTVLSALPGCDLQQGCRAGEGSFAVELRFAAPPRAMKAFPIALRVAAGEAVETVMISFAMRGMDMGLNRYRMVRGASNTWTADVTLPICVSGRSDWIAGVELVTARRRFQWDVPFVLEK